MVEKIAEGYVPQSSQSFLSADRLLNETYQSVLKYVDESEERDFMNISSENIRSVQRQWIIFRDDSVNLFSKINPTVNQDVYKVWLIEQRIEDLNEIYNLYD